MFTTLLSFLMSLATFGPAEASVETREADQAGVMHARAEVTAVIATCPFSDRLWLISEDSDDDDFGDGDGIISVASVSSTVVFGAKLSGSIRKDFARPSPAQRCPILRC